MKPRITKGHLYVFLGLTIHLDGWSCTDGIIREWGVTPKGAYDAWHAKSTTPRWRPGQVVEQHTCPSRPTWFQSWWRHGLIGILNGRR